MIYFVVLILLFLFSILDEIIVLKKENRNVIFFFAFLTIIILAGLRGNVEPDYSHYLNIYNSAQWNNYFKNDSVEIGYYYYNVILKDFGIGFQFVIFSMAFVTVFFKLKILKEYSPNYIISFLLYYCSLFFLYDFIAIRQALAMSIFMLSIPHIINRNLPKFLLYIGIAALFHISVLILIPVYFLLKYKYNNFIVLLVLLACLGLNIANVSFPLIDFLRNYIPLPSFTKAKLDFYSMETEYAFISVRLLIFAFIFLFYKWIVKTDEKFNLFFNLFFIGVLITTLFNEIPQFSYRIKAYFLWTDVLLWVFIIEKTFKQYIILKIFSYAVLISIYTITLLEFLKSVSERGNYIYPFKFFWET